MKFGIKLLGVAALITCVFLLMHATYESHPDAAPTSQEKETPRIQTRLDLRTTPTNPVPQANPHPASTLPGELATLPSPQKTVGIPTQTIRLQLQDRTLTDLEENLSKIRLDVYLEKLPAGWRVHFDRENTLMSQIGFNDGDLIDRSMIEDNFSKREGSLKRRLLALFSQLEN